MCRRILVYIFVVTVSQCVCVCVCVCVIVYMYSALFHYMLYDCIESIHVKLLHVHVSLSDYNVINSQFNRPAFPPGQAQPDTRWLLTIHNLLCRKLDQWCYKKS